MQNGIGRVLFGILFVVWGLISFVIGSAIAMAYGNPEVYLWRYTMYIPAGIGWAFLSYLRFKNAGRKNYIIGMMIVGFFPIFYLIPFLVGIILKPDYD